MFRRNVCLAALIAVAVQVTAVHSIAAVSLQSSICSTVEKCYVNGSTSKLCDRSKKTCNPCLYEMQSGSTSSSSSQYGCYAADDDGVCPQGTTECSATLEKTDTSNEETSSESPETGNSDTTSDSVETPSSTTRRRPSASNSTISTETTSPSPSPRKRNSTVSDTSTVSRDETSLKKETTTKLMKPATNSSSSSLSGDDESENEVTVDDSHTPEQTTQSGKSKESSSPEQSTETKKTQPVPESLNVSPSTDTSKTTQSSKQDKPLSDNQSSTTASADSSSGIPNLGVILGIIGGAGALVAFAGFVFWKKKRDDDDSDDETRAYPSNKPTLSRNVVSLPSASSATAYAAEPNYYKKNNTYENQYNNNYGNNSSNHYPSTASTNYTAGSAPGVVPASYGSSSSLDFDDENRRTDSILGGTGVMASSTASSMQTPFEFTGGPSPANSEGSQDAWGNDVGSFRQKRTASSASVEF